MLPMALCGRGYRRVDFAGDDSALGFQGKRNRQRAVTRVGADLKIASNAEEACEQRHQLGLFRRKQHVDTGKVSRFLANELELRMFAKADSHEVVVERVA